MCVCVYPHVFAIITWSFSRNLPWLWYKTGQTWPESKIIPELARSVEFNCSVSACGRFFKPVFTGGSSKTLTTAQGAVALAGSCYPGNG